MNHNPFILLWLEAPMQSWGFSSQFSSRDTQKFPTKSGILGLLCCALGASGEQRELLSKFSQLKHSVVAFKKNYEPTTLLRDFHMVGSGYDDKDSWQKLMIPKKSDGSKAVGGGTKLTYRYYLQDVAFAVAIETPREEVERIADKLQNPVWDIYLGRKNCIPTDFIYRGQFKTQSEALEYGQIIAKDKKLIVDFKVYDRDTLLSENERIFRELTLNDIPISFGVRKEYHDRRIVIINE